ncbi:MAG TPA: four helix bundle protein [Rhodanobacteraceae bacterium]|nr:four helix bundle protein [Rhodanobacteraceae bacterium]
MGSAGAAVKSYRDLDAWQEAMQLVEQIYEVVAAMPIEERFGLTQQLKRAAVSVPSNIAEGHARGATRDFTRFLSMARGSVAEIETQIELAIRIGLLEAEIVEPIVQRCDKLGRILRGLRKSLDSKLARA